DTVSASGTNGSVERAVVTERTFDNGGNVTRTRVYRNDVQLTLPPDITNVTSALTNAGNDPANLHADDHVQWTVYDLRGRAIYSIDGTGAVVKSQYDLSANVTAQIAYSTRIALNTLMNATNLDSWSAVSAVANATDNRVTKFWYDGLARACFSLDAEGYLVETRYLDSTNQQQSIVYAGKPTIGGTGTLADVVAVAAAAPHQSSNQTTTQKFDVAGRVTQVTYGALTDPNSKSEYFVYDAIGNKIQYVNKKAASASDLAYTWTYDYD